MADTALGSPYTSSSDAYAYPYPAFSRDLSTNTLAAMAGVALDSPFTDKSLSVLLGHLRRFGD